MNFDEFWKKHEQKYKSLAQQDFEKLQQGAFCAMVRINTDDDFSLDIGENISVYGNSKKDVIKNLIKTLENAQFTYCKTWSVISKDVEQKGDYSKNWFFIRDEAIKELKAGNTNIEFGGNQTIEISIFENKIAFLEEKTKKIKP